MLLSSKPSMITQSLALTNPKFNPMSISTTTTTIKSMSNDRISRRRASMSALEARVSLVFALAAQTSALSQRLLMDLATGTAKYVNTKRFEGRNLEEALMAVPDLETVEFKVLSRRDQYEIREVECILIVGLCTAAAIKRRAQRKQLVSQESSESVHESESEDTEWSEPRLGCGSIKKTLMGSVRWSNVLQIILHVHVCVVGWV